MKPFQAYRKDANHAPPRREVLLQLCDSAILLAEKALELLRHRDAIAARPHLLHARAIVEGLGESVDSGFPELPKDFARSCEFVQHCLSTGGIENTEAARKTLRELRDGLKSIRTEARQRKHTGQLPPTDTTHGLMTMA